MRGIVVDASITATWLMPDENNALALAVLNQLRQQAAIVPPLFWFEIRNLLIEGERRHRLTQSQTATALNILAALPFEVDAQADSQMVMQLARDQNLSVYDAAYLELALRRTLPLATIDKALATASRFVGVSVMTKDSD